MSKKFSFIFSLLVFAILFSFIGCTDLLAPKAQTDINLNIDLSKIIKSSRNDGSSQGASSLGDNPTIKVAIYDAKDYDKATNSTENLTLITQAQASVGGDGIARVKLSDIPVGIDAIVFAELSFTDENSTEVMYAGNSKVFKVKASDNKISLVLMKVGNSEIYPDDTNTPYENYTLYKKTENGEEEEVSNNTEASISTSSTKETNVTINPDSSDSVWTYFVKPINNTRFTEDGNYKVSVELKTKSDATTVVGIAAAKADYFFTVNDTWTPCEFETGYVKGSTDHDFTIGLGLSSEIQIKNLKIEKLSEIDTTEPSLVFDISRHAIETYLGKDDRPEKIIDVSTNGSYNITINTPMCHSGTDDSYIQDVKLHLRSYATENTGANRVSFKVDNLGANTFYTSVMADTANEKSTAWNNGTNKIDSGRFDFYEIDFPNYVANDELIVDLITSSTSTSQDNSTSFTVSEFKVEKAGDSPFNGKIFAIQVGETWTQEKSVEVTIPVNDYKEFDVGMFNGWNSNMPSSFDDVTRFFYTGDTKIKDDLIYSVNNDNPNEPKFIITNDSGEDKIVKITLNEKYEVVIEDVSSIVTTWADLKYRIDNTSISEIVIKNDLIATERIYIGRRIVKIIADRNVIITRGGDDGFFNIFDYAGLELGCEEYSITLDGKNETAENRGPLIWQYSQGLGVTLTNCILQNNTTTAEVGAIKTEQLFTMNNCSISNCHGSKGGAVYTFAYGSFTMNGGSISGCTATENGNAVYIGSGNLTLSGDAEITSDVYIANENSVIVAGDLTKDKVATITLPSYYDDRPVITAADSSITLAKQVGKFTLSKDEYTIAQNGKLAKKETIIYLTQEVLESYRSNNDRYSLPAGEYCVTGNLILSYPIQISASGSEVKLYSNEDCTISCSSNFSTSLASTIIQLPMSSGKLSLGGGAGTLTIDGKNQDLSYLVISQSDLELTNNCSIKNGTVSFGAIYISAGTFTMNGGTIENNTTTNTCSGIYTSGNPTTPTTIRINNGTISNNWVNNENKGASIYCTGGTVYLPDGLTVTSNGMFTKNIINGAIQDVATGGGNATQSITTFSALRSAIDEANTNSSSYTLENPCVIYIGDSFSTDGDTASTLTIRTHVKLVANNTDGCIITKTSVYAGTNIFIVSPGASLTLGDETATGILTIDGAGSSVQSTKSLINVSGTLVLNEKSVLQNSYIENSTHGGAVYSSGGTINVHGGVVQNNTIIVNSKYGGGIYLKNGTFEMTSGKFQENSGSVSSGYMYGGALYFDSCTVNITGGTFINNSVLDSTDCYGGAIYISNSGNTSTPAKISNCTFNSNSAYQRGGAIFIGGTTTCININKCTFNDNSVTNSTAAGGAIYVANTSGGSVTILDCNFANNTASSSENTIYNGSSSVSVIVDGTTVPSSSVWNPSTSGGD